MKDLKKRNIVRTIVLLVPLLLGLAAVTSAQNNPACTYAGVAGEWGDTFTGTFYPPPGKATLIAAVGKATFDAHGNFSETVTSTTSDTASQETATGTYILNSDCTGTMTVSVHDESGNTPDRTATWALVFVDNARELRGIMTSEVAHLPPPPDGPGDVSVPAVITRYAKKLFPDSQNQQ
ncbi:MAG: hypothetical protein P8Z30_06760 [Acidobacteriota bacterium]